MTKRAKKYLFDISIDDTIVWAIKTNHLPELKKEIEDIMKL